MLNRGEIAFCPVWVDMFYTWQADGRLNPSIKLSLPEPGMPGQPMYYVVPAKTPNAELAVKFIELATSPAVQAEGIVERRSEEHTSELQSLMRISYAVFCLQKKKHTKNKDNQQTKKKQHNNLEN